MSEGVQRELDEAFARKFGTSGDGDNAQGGGRKSPLPTHIVFLDGFLLYYDEQLRSQIDLPIFLRIGRELLKERRDKRGGYVTAEGDCWKVS